MSVLPSHHGTVAACSAGGKKLEKGYNGEDNVLAHELTVGDDDGDECGGGGNGKDVDGVGGQLLGNIDPVPCDCATCRKQTHPPRKYFKSISYMLRNLYACILCSDLCRPTIQHSEHYLLKVEKI